MECASEKRVQASKFNEGAHTEQEKECEWVKGIGSENNDAAELNEMYKKKQQRQLRKRILQIINTFTRSNWLYVCMALYKCTNKIHATQSIIICV